MSFDNITHLMEVFLGLPCRLILETEHRPFKGGESLAFVIEDTCGNRYCFKVPTVSQEDSRDAIQRQTQHLKAISGAGINLYQSLVTFDTTCNNLIQNPFIVMNWVDGIELIWTDDFPSSRADREKVMKSIANASMDLLKISSDGCTATAYINERLDKIEQAQHIFLPDGPSTDFTSLRQLISQYVIPEFDNAPHVIVHGDLSGSNIIVDEAHNVKGIIDLGSMSMVPLQFAAIFPLFLIHPRNYTKNYFNRSFADMSSVWHTDRQFYLQCVEKRASSVGGLAKDYYTILARKDEFERYWWLRESSQNNLDVSKASKRWSPPGRGCQSIV